MEQQEVTLEIGRIVHYVSYGTPGGEYQSVCRPAMITQGIEVEGVKSYNVVVFNPTGLFFNICEYDVTCAPGTIHWPTDCAAN